MNKKNKILVGCLALLLALSVGYALFSETITINGSATAKGSFDITTTCTQGFSEELVEYLGLNNADEGQGGFANSICNVNGNIVTLSTDLLYPTASRGFTVKMTNTGSIPAIIWGADSGSMVESFDISNSVSWFFKNKETNEIIKSGNGPEIDDHNEYTDSGWGTIVISSEGILNSDKNFIYDSSKGYTGIKLNPGDSAISYVAFRYPDYADRIMSDNGISEYFEFKLNHEFKWEQYTDNPNYESTTFDGSCFAGC